MTSPSTSILSSLTRAAFALALSAPILACGGIEPDAVEPDAVDTESADEAITIGPLQLSRIVYQRSGEIRSMANDGTGDVLHTSGSRPSYSQGRTRMAYATGGAIKVVDAPFDAAAFAAAFTVYSGSGTWAGVDPAISLDGTKVTFATAGLGGYGATLFHYTMGTNNPVTMIDGSGTWVFHPTFNASGSQVAYTVGNPSLNNGLNIRRVNATVVNQPAATAGVLTVTGGYRPSFSPNGLKLAYYRSVAGAGYDIFIADASGANPQPFINNSPYDDQDPTFSPGSTLIAFVSKNDYWSCSGLLCFNGNTSHAGKNLWKGSLDGNTLDNLTTNSSAATSYASPSWR